MQEAGPCCHGRSSSSKSTLGFLLIDIFPCKTGKMSNEIRAERLKCAGRVCVSLRAGTSHILRNLVATREPSSSPTEHPTAT